MRATNTNKMPVDEALKIMQVEDTISADDLKTKFRELAKTLHPDVNKEPKAEERFKKLTQAYDLLKDQVPFTHPFARPSFSKPAPGAGFDKNNNAWPFGDPDNDSGFGRYFDNAFSSMPDFFNSFMKSTAQNLSPEARKRFEDEMRRSFERQTSKPAPPPAPDTSFDWEGYQRTNQPPPKQTQTPLGFKRSQAGNLYKKVVINSIIMQDSFCIILEGTERFNCK